MAGGLGAWVGSAVIVGSSTHQSFLRGVPLGLLVGGAICVVGSVWSFGVVRRRAPSTTPPTTTPQVAQEPASTPLRRSTGRTLRDLRALFDGLTDLQGVPVARPFIGTWLTVSGAVSSVHDFETFVQVTLDVDDDNPYLFIFFIFTSDAWREALARLSEGDHVTIHGEIERLSGTDIQLTDCELVEAD